MEDFAFWLLTLTIPVLVIVAGALVIRWGIAHATRLAELQHEQRLAMIERGLTPPDDAGRDRLRRSYGFKMSFGIMLSGLGLGLAILIAFAGGAIDIGVGVGGAVLMVGLAFVVSAVFTERQGPSMDERMAAREAGMRGARAVAPPTRVDAAPPDGPPAT